MKKYSKKIMLGAFAAFALIVVILVFVFAFANRTTYYECVEYSAKTLETYDEKGKPVYKTDNYLKNYSTYRLYLDEKGSTFKLIVCLSGSSEEKTYQGFYTITKDILKLDYKDGYATEPEAIYYNINGDKLVRIKDANDKTEGDYQIYPARATIYQEFEKKLSW